MVSYFSLASGFLTMVSMPAYDPNSFSDGIGRTEWKMLSDDPRRPLLNKVLNALYPPGSTFKVVTATAALDSGKFADNIAGFGGDPHNVTIAGESAGSQDVSLMLAAPAARETEAWPRTVAFLR